MQPLTANTPLGSAFKEKSSSSSGSGLRKKSVGAGSRGDDKNNDDNAGEGSSSSNNNKSAIKTVFGGLADFFSNQKKMEISTPYDPVHLTHVGFNVDTGEFTGLPKEWQQLLQDSGISKQEQLAHPQAVVDIVKFYQDATKKELSKPGAEDDDVWMKFGGAQQLQAQQYGDREPLGYAAHLTQPVSNCAFALISSCLLLLPSFYMHASIRRHPFPLYFFSDSFLPSLSPSPLSMYTHS